MKTKILTGLMPVITMSLVACSSGMKKADLPSNANPTDEISKLQSDVDAGYAGQYDVLAKKDFAKAESYLKEAKEELADGENQKDVLEEVAYGRAYFERARAAAESRRGQIAGVLNARQAALDAQVRNNPKNEKAFRKLDDELRSESDHLANLSAAEISDLQARYYDLQLLAMKHNHLGQAISLIEDAKDDDAADDAPTALRQAEVDLATAENLMKANRNNPEAYQDAAAKAVTSAEFLSAVLKETNGGKVNEVTATNVVVQRMKISSLQGTVGTLQGELGTVSQEMGQKNQALLKRERELAGATAAVNFQKALDHARKQFSPEEAEVFQEGDKLLIRLKAINFGSGRSDLPAQSASLLAKVKAVAEGLGPQQILVEGHTDSTGSAEVNSELSEARAEAVTNYFSANGIDEAKLQSVGHGFEKPIASNKSAAGRAQNRRVDILITPTGPVERQPASIDDDED
jgi:outer membrane protein OmpA-like peptidoglycan-associated protein